MLIVFISQFPFTVVTDLTCRGFPRYTENKYSAPWAWNNIHGLHQLNNPLFDEIRYVTTFFYKQRFFSTQTQCRLIFS